MADLDHLVYATLDLDATIADLEDRLGIRATYGGRHLGRGTRNALIALSDLSYLEIIGPDPEQSERLGPRWFGIDALTGPRLVTWAVKSTNVEQVAADAARAGVTLGRVGSGSRQTSDGSTLHWQFTDPDAMIEDGLVPFFIDWGTSQHPASTAPRGLRLVSLHAHHPEPDRLERVLSGAGIVLPVERGAASRLDRQAQHASWRRRVRVNVVVDRITPRVFSQQYIMLRDLIQRVLVVTALASPLGAQGAADAIPAHDTLSIASRSLGERRPINVHTPAGYRASSDTRFPVLYMPDGGLDEDFPHVVKTVDSLIALHQIRPVIVVGIPNTERRRDLTGPTRIHSDSAVAPHVGGSAAFRRFIG